MEDITAAESIENHHPTTAAKAASEEYGACPSCESPEIRNPDQRGDNHDFSCPMWSRHPVTAPAEKLCPRCGYEELCDYCGECKACDDCECVICGYCGENREPFEDDCDYCCDDHKIEARGL